jgi:hypothetical protein
MRIIHHNCDPSMADDRSLPCTAYLVTYKIDGAIAYDLVIASKKIEIFDYYWDRYRDDFVTFKQSEGRVNPKLWAPAKKQEKKK